MTKYEYSQYLKTPHWRKLRLQTLNRFMHKCAPCGSSKKLQVHHMTYERNGKSVLYNEIDADLVALCDVCHQTWHMLLRSDGVVTKRIYRKIEETESWIKANKKYFRKKTRPPATPKQYAKAEGRRHKALSGDGMVRELYGLTPNPEPSFTPPVKRDPVAEAKAARVGEKKNRLIGTY